MRRVASNAVGVRVGTAGDNSAVYACCGSGRLGVGRGVGCDGDGLLVDARADPVHTPSPAPAAVSAVPSAPAVTSPALPSPSVTDAGRGTSTPTPRRSVVRVTPTASVKRAAGPVLRTSYPGITRLVIVESYLNKTPAGIIALNTVAAYTSALATATTDRTIEPGRRRVASSCVPCTSDLSRIASYVAKGRVVTLTDGKPNTWKSVALFISSVSPAGVVTIDFDGIEGGVVMKSKSGSVIVRDGSTSVISEEDDVDVHNGGKIIGEFGRS